MDAFVTFSPPRLREAATRLLAAAGTAEADARVVADHLVDSNLAGHDSHGVGMLPQYVRAIGLGVLDPRAHAAIAPGGGAVVSADGQKGFGQLVAREAMAAGIERARASGVAMVALRNAFHIGRVGTYGEQAAAAGMASLHFVNVVGHGPLVAPHGGTDARLTTNPVCISLPGGPGGEPVFLLDFATSIIALGKVRVAMQRKEQVAPGILLDGQGAPTTDPSVMFSEPHGAILPIGIYKGYGLALACELLAGALAGGGTLPSVAPQTDRITNNMLAFVVDPGRLPGAAELATEVARAIGYVKASPPADPAAPVLVAGEPEKRSRTRREAAGIPIERATFEHLQAAATSVGLPAASMSP